MTGEPAQIQPHGFLLALSDEWLVQGASLNVGNFLGRDPRELLGQPASTLLSVDAIHSLRNRLALLRGPDAIERLFRCQLTGNDDHFDVAVHFSGDSTILEAEPSSGHAYGDVTSTVRGMIARLDKATTLAELLDAGTRQLRAITGFDRVTITRFDGRGGEILAECARSGIGTRLGEQVAPTALDEFDQYRRAPLHVIADNEATMVPIVPSLDESGDPLDLSHAVLRSPSPARAAALREAEAKAAMSIALIVGENLWGLVDCHHSFARCPGFERRSMADLFVQMFAMRIRIHELEKQISSERA
jgi:light-regulated signal transduction histidine kinase (bacteriophytochrome)